MSIEFTANFDQPIPPSSLPRLKDYLVRNTRFDIVRDNGAEFGLADSTRKEHASTEEIAILVDSNRVYVAFHCSTRDERAAFLAVATQALDNVGIISTFEEL